MVPALLHLAYTEGADGLYAGMGTACASLGISNLLYYALYALLRDALLRASPQRTSLGGVAALPVAAMAGALNVLATNPLWVLVTRLQAHRGGNGGDADAGAAPRPLAVARQVYAEGGIAAFWRGTGASLVMVSNPVVQFAVFEWLMARAAARARARAGPGGKAAPVGKATVFASGALSKLAATLVTYPFLVLKSRQQAAQRPVPAPASGGDKDGEAAVRAAHPVRVRLLAQLLAVAREEGVQGAVGGPGARESGQCGRHCVAGEGRGVNRMACFLAASPPAVAGVQAPHGTRSEPTPPFHRSVPGAGHEAVPDRARGRHPVHHQGHHHPGDSQSHAQDCEAGLNEISSTVPRHLPHHSSTLRKKHPSLFAPQLPCLQPPSRAASPPTPSSTSTPMASSSNSNGDAHSSNHADKPTRGNAFRRSNAVDLIARWCTAVSAHS